MKRSAVTRKVAVLSDSSDDEEPLKKPQGKNRTEQQDKKPSSDSSSESDIENYLQPAHKLNLDSTFFQTTKDESKFAEIEDNIFSGVNRLADSESEEEEENKQEDPQPSRINFQQLQDYTTKIEEAKKLVEKYEAKKKARAKPRKRDDVTVSDLLAIGESMGPEQQAEISDSDKEDWEEVEEGKQEEESIVPKDGVQITIQSAVGPKKKGVDLLTLMKRRLNKIKRDTQVLIHKVHLLGWIAHGNYTNKILNSESLLTLALSLLPSQHCYPTKRTDLSYLEQIVQWYHNAIPYANKVTSKGMNLEKMLKMQINRNRAFNKKMHVYIFICILRSLGIQCRLVLSFQVAPLRPPAIELHSFNTKKEENESQASTSSSTKTKATKNNVKSTNATSREKKLNNSNLMPKKSIIKSSGINESKSKHKNNSEPSKERPKLNKLLKNKSASTSSEIPQVDGVGDSDSDSSILEVDGASGTTNKLNISQVDGADGSDSSSSTQKVKKPNLKKLSQDNPPAKRPKQAKPSAKNEPKNSISKSQPPPKLNKLNIDKAASTSRGGTLPPSKSKSTLHRSPFFSTGRPLDVRDDIIALMKGRLAQERAAERARLTKNRRLQRDDDYDSDYALEPVKKKKPASDDEFYEQNKVKVKRRVKPRKEAEEEAAAAKQKCGVDAWVEVYLEVEEAWISADVTRGEVHCAKELYVRASHPVTYIVAWDNDNSIKDITQRYCRNWNTVTRKLRIDKKWWQDALRPFEGPKTPRDREEDEELARLQLDQPLPTSMSEYKGHPLYVLKRHLLKFEALYPPNCFTLGFMKGEAVYSRDCVQLLHSREVWIKHAKVVKEGEEAYKIVKARSKYDKLSGQVISDKPLELFGKWQVQDYVPPVAQNGIVPRNMYGNVDLFKPSMLPKGTVHLQLPGINKLAKRMNFDCAPAVVGFDFHTGGSHPTFDGFVVCEEHSEPLIAAWYMEQEENEQKQKEKHEKRVYGNWRKLIRGLLIRERLKARYDFGEPSKRKKKATKSVPKKHKAE